MARILLFFLVFVWGDFLFGQDPYPDEIVNSVRRANALKLLDLDSDGDLDVVFHEDQTNRICFFLNLGNDSFSDKQYLNLGHEINNDWEFFDVDLDGDLDVLFCTAWPDYKIYFFENQGSLLFTESQYIMSSDVRRIYFDDFNLDGFQDLVLFASEGVYTYKNEAGESFESLDSNAISPAWNYSLYRFDIDDNGVEEILFGTNGVLKRVEIDIEGNIQLFGEVVLPGYSFKYPIATADFNSDDLLDYFVIERNPSSPNYKKLVKLVNDGNNQYLIGQVFFVNKDYDSFQIIDWNQDGIDDLIAFEFDYIDFYLGTEEYDFQYSHQSFLWTSAYELKMADINSDGKKEIFMHDNPGLLNYYKIEGNLFVDRIFISFPYSSVKNYVCFDYLEDGDLDILSTEPSRDFVVLNENLGVNQKFQNRLVSMSETPYQLYHNPIQLYRHDQNQDGEIEILALNPDDKTIKSYDNYLNLISQKNYSALFYEPQLFDINNDSILDIFYYNLLSQKLEFSISTAQSYSYQGQEISYDLRGMTDYGDMDGDGDMDVLVFDEWQAIPHECFDEIGVLIQDSLQFEYHIIETDGCNPKFVDFNNDGFLDVELWKDGDIRIYLNSDSGFTDDYIIPFNNYLGSWHTDYIDLNDDGMKDFIFENRVYLQNSDGELSQSGLWPFFNIYEDNHVLKKFHRIGQFFPELGQYVYYPGLNTFHLSEVNIDYFPIYINGLSFFDSNQNGYQDIGENEIQIPLQFSSDNSSNISFGNNAIYISDWNGEIDITPVYNANIWEITTDTSNLSVDLSVFNPDSISYEIGFFTSDSLLHLKADMNEISWSCANNIAIQSLSCKSLSTYELNTIFSYSTEMDIEYFIPEPDSINGNNFYWLNEMVYGDIFNVYVAADHPGANSIGEQIQSSCKAWLQDEAGNWVIHDSDNISQLVACSYDPNDKLVEEKGFTHKGYILADTTLTYTVRFQNTGNAPAETVKIYDNLDRQLDWNSFEFLATSHEVSTNIDDEGNIVFLFENINLPDSGADFLASNGYVKFKVDIKEETEPGTEIRNNARIYFDNNPAIITNYTLNTIYTCEWLYDTLELVIDSREILAPENGLNYEWYFEGELIENLNDFSFTPEKEGEYSCVIEMQGDCKVPTKTILYDPDNLYNKLSDPLVVYPNPASTDFGFIGLPQRNFTLRLYDSYGKLVKTQFFKHRNDRVAVDQLPKGLYIYSVEIDGFEKQSGRVVVY